MKMLYSQRRAYAAMGRWRPVHRLLWAIYWPLARFAPVRTLWRTYRKLWP